MTNAEALAKALEPFAEIAEFFEYMADQDQSFMCNVSLSTLRTARSALAGYRSRPAAEVVVAVPEFSDIAKRKLESLLAEGWRINGYALFKDMDRRGFIDCYGFVGWWLPEYYRNHTSDDATPALAGTEPAGEVVEPRKYWPEPGDKMQFLDKNGYDGERERAGGFFNKDQIVTVKRIEIGSFHHTIEFEEVPGKRFNGVMFAALRDQSEA